MGSSVNTYDNNGKNSQHFTSTSEVSNINANDKPCSLENHEKMIYLWMVSVSIDLFHLIPKGYDIFR